MGYSRTKIGESPVSLEDLKAWNYIEDEIFDGKLTVCLHSAIAAAETYTNQTFWPSLYTLDVAAGAREISVPLYPVAKVEVFSEGEPLPSSRWSFDGSTVKVDGSVSGPVSIEVMAGRESIDPDVKAAILLVASELFRNPTDSVRTLPSSSQLLLQSHRHASV